MLLKLEYLMGPLYYCKEDELVRITLVVYAECDSAEVTAADLAEKTLVYMTPTNGVCHGATWSIAK